MGKTRKVRKSRKVLKNSKGGGKSRPTASKSKLASKVSLKPGPIKKSDVFSMNNLLGALENMKSNAPKPTPTPKKSLLNMKNDVFEENPVEQLEEVGEKITKLNKEKSIKIAGPYSLVMHVYEPELREFLDESNIEDLLITVREAEDDPKDFLKNVSLMFASLADTYDATDDDADRNRIADLAYNLLIDLFEIISPDTHKKLLPKQAGNAFKMNSLLAALNTL